MARNASEILTRYVGSDVKTAGLLRPYWFLATFLAAASASCTTSVATPHGGPTFPGCSERSIITYTAAPLRTLPFFLRVYCSTLVYSSRCKRRRDAVAPFLFNLPQPRAVLGLALSSSSPLSNERIKITRAHADLE